MKKPDKTKLAAAKRTALRLKKLKKAGGAVRFINPNKRKKKVGKGKSPRKRGRRSL